MDLLEFLESVYRHAGGLVERGPDVLEALAPENSTLPEMVRFATRSGDDGAASPAGGELESLHLGHPALESALAVAREGGRLSVRHVSGARAPQRNLEAEFRKAFAFRNARAAYEPVRSVAVPWAIFHFRLTYTWDEKREELLAVGVDLHTGAVIEPRVVEKAFLEPGPLPDADRRGLERAYESACRHLPRAVEPRVQAFTRESLRHREVEETRLEEYYGQILHDLESRMAGARSAPDRLAGLQAKKEQAEAERDTRRRDLEEKFRLKCSAHLVCVELIDVPRALVPVRLETRPTCRSLRLSYNLFTHDFDRLPCDSCGTSGTDFYLCAGGHLACPRCYQECAGCRTIACPTCAPPRCAHCDGPVCPRCSPPCAVCGGSTCVEHAALCHEAPRPPAPAAVPSDSSKAEVRPKPAPAQPAIPGSATARPVPTPVTIPSSRTGKSDWTSIDRGLVMTLFTDLCGRIRGLDALIRPIDAAAAHKDMDRAIWETQNLLDRLTLRDKHLLDRLRRVLNCLKARPPQRALDRLRDLHQRLVRDGILRQPAAPSKAEPSPRPSPSPAAPSRRPAPPAPSRKPAPSAPSGPSPAAPSRVPASLRQSDASHQPTPPAPTYLPVPRDLEEPGDARPRRPVCDGPGASPARDPVSASPPSRCTPEASEDSRTGASPAHMGPRQHYVRVLLQRRLEADECPQPMIAQALDICQRAGELVEASESTPPAWAAAFAYLACARAFATAMTQKEAGELFGVSGGTVSLRAREVIDFLGK